MKLFDKIKEKTKKITDSLKTPSFGVLKTTLLVDTIFPKTTKKITGVLEILPHKKVKIKSIRYQVVEAVDPIIGKRKEEADSLSESQTKKGFTIAEEANKEITFSLPIKFADKHSKFTNGGDMHLLNHMSERSRKTAINYQLKIDITYIIDGEKESHNKKISHDVRFE